MHVIVFDTETTGLPLDRKTPPSCTEDWPSIVQISWIEYDTLLHKIIGMGDHLVRLRSGVTLSPASTAVHGITRSLLSRKGVSPELAIEEFLAALGRSDRVIAHNLDFDQAVVQAECYRQGLQNPFGGGARPYCTAKAGVPLVQAWCEKNGRRFLRFPKLWELHKELFNHDVDNLHVSLADVLVCLRCYLLMVHDSDLMNCTRARQLYALYRIGSTKRCKLTSARYEDGGQP